MTKITPDLTTWEIDNIKVCPIGIPQDLWPKYSLRIISPFNTEFKSLYGCPRRVNGNFSILNQAHLTSLQHNPEHVGGEYELRNIENLKNLQHITQCDNYFFGNLPVLNKIDYLPKVLEKLLVSSCPQVSYTECKFNHITELGWFENKDTNLHNFHKSFPAITYLNLGQQTTGGLLSVLLIDDLKTINLDHNNKNDQSMKALIIIRSYLGKGKAGVYKCAQELIKAGLQQYATI